MSSIIKYDVTELEELIKDYNKTCIVKNKITQTIAFQPWCLNHVNKSIKSIMNNKIGKYDEQLKGIILSYKNIKILNDVYEINKDRSELYSDVEADFYVFQPYVGATLRGVVSKKCMTHLGVLVHKVFNVVIPTPPHQTADTWIGSKLHVGQQIEFKIIVLDLYGALPYIRGALDERFLPPISDEIDSTLDVDDCESLRSSSHVNFDGIKPIKVIKKDEKNSQSTDNGDTIKSKLKKKSKNDTSKSNKDLDHVPSDSDFVPDVDDSVLKEQDKLMKKILLADKKKKVKNIETLTPSTPGLKKLHDDEKKGKKRYETPNKKDVNDSIVIRSKKISLSKSDKNSECNYGAELNKHSNSSTPVISPGSSRSYKPNQLNNQEKSPVKSSKSKKKDLNHTIASSDEISSITKFSKKEKKRHSLDLNHLSNGVDIQKLCKKDSSMSQVDGKNVNNSVVSTNIITEVESNAKNVSKLEKKRLKDANRNTSLDKIDLKPQDVNPDSKEVSKNGNSQLNSPSTSTMIHLTPKAKRKRKYSESFQHKSDDILEQSLTHTSPSRKKRKKDKSSIKDHKLTDSFDDYTSQSESMNLSADTSIKVKKKKKKRDKEVDKEERTNLDNSKMNIDINDRMQKVQDLLLQIASDPTLLTDIQTFMSSRKST